MCHADRQLSGCLGVCHLQAYVSGLGPSFPQPSEAGSSGVSISGNRNSAMAGSEVITLLGPPYCRLLMDAAT